MDRTSGGGVTGQSRGSVQSARSRGQFLEMMARGNEGRAEARAPQQQRWLCLRAEAGTGRGDLPPPPQPPTHPPRHARFGACRSARSSKAPPPHAQVRARRPLGALPLSLPLGLPAPTSRVSAICLKAFVSPSGSPARGRGRGNDTTSDFYCRGRGRKGVLCGGINENSDFNEKDGVGESCPTRSIQRSRYAM